MSPARPVVGRGTFISARHVSPPDRGAPSTTSKNGDEVDAAAVSSLALAVGLDTRTGRASCETRRSQEPERDLSLLRDPEAAADLEGAADLENGRR